MADIVNKQTYRNNGVPQKPAQNSDKKRISERTIEDPEIERVFRALASSTRFKILKLLVIKKMDVTRIALAIEQTEANISAQLKILEKAGLIISKYEPGEHGVRKVCELACDKLTVRLRLDFENERLSK